MNWRPASFGIIAAAIAMPCLSPIRILAQSNFVGQSNSLSRIVVDDALKAAAAKPTPRAANGHPDLNGSWVPLSSPSAPIKIPRVTSI